MYVCDVDDCGRWFCLHELVRLGSSILIQVPIFKGREDFPLSYLWNQDILPPRVLAEPHGLLLVLAWATHWTRKPPCPTRLMETERNREHCHQPGHHGPWNKESALFLHVVSDTTTILNRYSTWHQDVEWPCCVPSLPNNFRLSPLRCCKPTSTINWDYLVWGRK